MSAFGFDSLRGICFPLNIVASTISSGPPANTDKTPNPLGMPLNVLAAAYYGRYMTIQGSLTSAVWGSATFLETNESSPPNVPDPTSSTLNPDYRGLAAKTKFGSPLPNRLSLISGVGMMAESITADANGSYAGVVAFSNGGVQFSGYAGPVADQAGENYPATNNPFLNTSYDPDTDLYYPLLGIVAWLSEGGYAVTNLCACYDAVSETYWFGEPGFTPTQVQFGCPVPVTSELIGPDGSSVWTGAPFNIYAFSDPGATPPNSITGSFHLKFFSYPA